ncbi:MAG: hypothetical protein ACI870_000200 [Crocinitomicaceae bacterium]|jgi:hypothetical protein
MNKLKIQFLENKEEILVKLGKESAGPFTHIEGVFQKIGEFYDNDRISFNQGKGAIRDILGSKNNLKMNRSGYFSALFLAEKYVQNSIGKLGSKLSCHVHLEKKEGTLKYAFILQDTQERNRLSNYFIYTYQASEFLKFLHRIEFVNEEKFIDLEIKIKKTTLFSSDLLELSN